MMIMADSISNEILAGVGKKLRNGFLAGHVPASKVVESYRRNIKEASRFSMFGLSIFDLMRMEEETHNPILRAKLKECIELHKEKSKCSNTQNKQSLEKLENLRKKALRIGLRKVISSMKHLVKKSGDLEARIVLMLLETEFANLSAKKFHKLKNVIYERKSILLEELSYLLHDTGWKHGINYNTGKNASYIVYIYLPNGTQLSWHCNEYQMIYYYPEIQCEWDGQVCMTMEKILNYICTRFNIGTLDFERNAA
jgi:hypothetical protein